jgi:hypothetical protein
MPKKFFSSRTINVVAYVVLSISLIGYYFKSNHDSNILYALGIALAMLWSAVLLYWLKRRDQFWYGVLEIFLAALSLVYSTMIYSRTHSWDETTFDEFLKRVALIYLLIRGFGNVDDGVKKEFWLRDEVIPHWNRLRRFLFD